MKRTEIKRLFVDIDPGKISLLPVLDQFHEGVMITDTHGVILYMNDTQARIDDLRVNDAIGRSVSELYRVDEGASPTMTCLKTGKAIENLACYYRTHLGKVVNSVHNIHPIRADGRLIGAICYIADYKNIEQTLVEMKTKSEIASIQAALTATRGNAAGAARRLGISPQLMHYKLKRLGIDRRDFRETGLTKR